MDNLTTARAFFEACDYGIDQNVMYAPTAPVPIWPKLIYGALYFAQTPKLLIEIIDTSYIRRSLGAYL
jgi:hypothetical protein